MSAAVFSKKEALSHGFYQTQKYIGLILLIGLTFFLMSIVTGIFDAFAGKGTLSQPPHTEMDITEEQSNMLMKVLVDGDYISRHGMVTGRLRYLDDPNELELPFELEPHRREIFAYLQQFRYKLPFPRPVYFVLRVLLWSVTMLMNIGYIKMTLLMSRDQKPRLSELFTNVDYLIAYILGTLCYTAAFMGGLILLIVPGIIFSVMCQLYTFLIIDQGLGPIESLKRSAQLTKGSRMNLFVLGMLYILIDIAGALCLLVGLIWSVPTTSIAMAYVFDRLSAAESGGSGSLEDIIKSV